MSSVKSPQGMVKADEVIGRKVINTTNENLGKIEEVLIDKTSGKIRLVILSFGGFLGMGDKLFAFPWNSISYDADKAAFILNVSKEKLKTAPGFEKDNWPDLGNEQWGTTVYDYYGVKPYWTTREEVV